MGAWIETFRKCGIVSRLAVAPFMGAWIETDEWFLGWSMAAVAPFMGAWIETFLGAGEEGPQ